MYPSELPPVVVETLTPSLLVTYTNGFTTVLGTFTSMLWGESVGSVLAISNP